MKREGLVVDLNAKKDASDGIFKRKINVRKEKQSALLSLFKESREKAERAQQALGKDQQPVSTAFKKENNSLLTHPLVTWKT